MLKWLREIEKRRGSIYEVTAGRQRRIKSTMEEEEGEDRLKLIQLGETSDTGERVRLIRINTGEKVGFTAALLNTNAQSINSMTRPSVQESFTLYTVALK